METCSQTKLKQAVYRVFWKNPAVLSGKRYTSKEKRSTKFIFKQILYTVFGVFLEIDTRSHAVN